MLSAFSVICNFYEQYISHHQILFSIMSKLMRNANMKFTPASLRMNAEGVMCLGNSQGVSDEVKGRGEVLC